MKSRFNTVSIPFLSVAYFLLLWSLHCSAFLWQTNLTRNELKCNESQCEACPAGHFADKGKHFKCQICNVTYQKMNFEILYFIILICLTPSIGKAECACCPTGECVTYTDDNSTVDYCTSCARGYNQSRSNSSQCSACPAGYFAKYV